MPLRGVIGFLALALVGSPALALGQGTGNIRGRASDAGSGGPVAAVQISVEGTSLGAQTADDGSYTIRNVPAGSHVLVTRRVGYEPARDTVTVQAGATATHNFSLRSVATNLNEVVVTALGQTAVQRSLGVAQQTVSGADIAAAQQPNFVNAIQGRVAGVQVTSTSGVPGASSSIIIRGVSSISGSNQPLMIIDGLPMDNSTLATSALASDAPNSNVAFDNRGVDFTNRGADINPNDIESITVLKGPEAAALYGIDAANGAIVITTKRGKAGGGLEYSNSFRIETPRAKPEIQHVYGPQTDLGSESFIYFGDKYPAGTKFYDNVDNFFQTALTQNHNLSFSGATTDGKINYRLATGLTKQKGVVPTSGYDRVNVTAASQGQVTDWLNVDLSTIYSYADNDQPFKGAGGPLLGLLAWPSTDNASNYLNPSGTRRTITGLGYGSEIDNPYFSVFKNKINSKNSRFIANLALTFSPVSWGNIRTILGTDGYTNQNLLLRHPESSWGFGSTGIIDQADEITRNLNAQTLLNFNSYHITDKLSINGLLGNQVTDERTTANALNGQDFMDPNFVSANNTRTKFNRTTLTRRRRVSLFGQAVFNYSDYLYLTLQGRNDWTSTIPRPRNSFFYPSVTSSFIFSDAFPSIGKHMTGKLRAAYAEVGRDAPPYAYRPALTNATTSYAGYRYDFWGPNLALKPEFASSYEFGTELGFFDDRLGLDVTYYQKETKDQIVQNIRGSYGTGFVLFNMNGATTRNHGVEISLRGTPIRTQDFSWDILANFDRSRGKVLSLPRDLPESYVSDTWLYGNVRDGQSPGMSTMALTGMFLQRNDKGQILIDPTTGLPIRSNDFIDIGIDRQPDFTVGLSNTLHYKRFTFDVLLDMRKGGDIYNGTERYLTLRGLSARTLDREQPRVIEGVLKDGNENSANPTPNNITIIPAETPGYYTDMNEEYFIQKDVNWVRLRSATLSYVLPQNWLRNASVYVTGTDLFLITNYDGLDPVVNGNTAAVGGAGAVGFDYGNFPIPRGIDFGVRVAF
ncbi:MAG TPA: SusC/RagA family TonB-linked outer membrane protein [Gemmatimonadaceae bacterium]|jgi:Outer membrane receptor proteins, mostly Fe transport